MTAPQTLQAWIDEHGPLGPHEAATVTLMCGSRLLRNHRGRHRWSVKDLDAAHIVREESSLWGWRRAVSAPGGGPVPERDAVVAIGRLLHVALSGVEPPSYAHVPVSLRRLRPELPADIDGVVARALAGETSLLKLTLDLQRFLGISPGRLRLPRSMVWTAAAICLAIVLIAGARQMPGASPRDAEIDAQSRRTDSLWECSFGLAWMDEQTWAASFAESAVRIDVQRLGDDSAPVLWRTAWIAWLKQQANDYLTAEQRGALAASRLAVRLGPDHPQAMSAAIVHASTLQQRSAWDAATVLLTRAWRHHMKRIGLAEQSKELGRLSLALRRARFDRDRDGDGLADLLEETLGTPPDIPATALDTIAGRPARSYALPLSPGFLAAHLRGTQPSLEGFLPRAREAGEFTPLHALSSLQLGFAERYGWLLMVAADQGTCSVELDTGTSPRRLHVAILRDSGQSSVSAGGTTKRFPDSADELLLAGDYDPATRTIYWWTSAGHTWTTAFTQLPGSGLGPYGLRLLPSRAPDACRSVTWTLRGAEIAPM